jgi:hypothetical protein
VVILSSEDDLEQTAETMHASCLHKPVEEKALLDAVQRTRRDKRGSRGRLSHRRPR